MVLDRARFIKILALAESDHDGEALAAVRKAAKMARVAGMTLGQAAEAGHDGDGATLALNMALIRAMEAERRVKELERAAAGFDPESYSRGFEAGKQRGRAEAFGPLEHERAGYRHCIEALEAELETYRPPLDWSALAKAFDEEGARWGSAKAKALAARARKNALTIEDKVTLRHFAEKSS